MEKLTNYRKIIARVLRNHIASENQSLREELIIDKKQRHFLIVHFGWNGDDYSYLPIFHIELKDTGQVWIHENRSDISIEEELVKAKINQSDLFGNMISPTEPSLFPSSVNAFETA